MNTHETSPIVKTPVVNAQAGSPRALGYMALFLVIIAAFLLHFNLVQAPLQGDDFRLFFLDDSLHSPGLSITNLDKLPGAPLAAFMLSFIWWLSNGALVSLRAVGLTLFVLSALVIFQLLRLWFNDNTSVAAPLLGALLFTVSPAAPAVLGEFSGYPSLFAVLFGLVAAMLFLGATRCRNSIDWLRIVLSSVFFAAAFAAHHALVILPLVLVVLDAFRFEDTGKVRLSPLWLGHVYMVLCAIALVAVTHVTGGVMPAAFLLPWYSIAFIAAFPLAWLIRCIPHSLPQRVLTIFVVLLLPLGAVAAFRLALRHVSPIFYLEQQLLSAEDSSLRRDLALHYLRIALEAQETEAVRIDRMHQSMALWSIDETTGDKDAQVHLLFAEALNKLGNTSEATACVAPTFFATPFSDAGRRSALMLARTLEPQQSAARIADLYAYAGRREAPEPEDALLHAMALMQTGDMENAAIVFEMAPSPPEDSIEAKHKQRAQTVRTIAENARETAREQLLENPMDAQGYISLAENAIAYGNIQRGFYWLELALRRDKQAETAWHMMGVVLARNGMSDHFISHWGDVKAPTSVSWLQLARQTALLQLWEEALVYASRRYQGEGPTPEEYLAAFALELERLDVAAHWLNRAVETHPDAFSPWLFKTDLALSQQRMAEARQFLEEARQRNAPVDDLEKRLSAMETPDGPEDQTAIPFEPVRSVIQ